MSTKVRKAAAKAKRMNLLYATVPVDERNDITDLPPISLSKSSMACWRSDRSMPGRCRR